MQPTKATRVRKANRKPMPVFPIFKAIKQNVNSAMLKMNVNTRAISNFISFCIIMAILSQKVIDSVCEVI